MNLYLPYEESFCKNLACLDDKTLNEQIADCYIVLSEFISTNGKRPRNKFYKHYFKYIAFLAEYGQIALLEYHYRFTTYHRLNDSYNNLMWSFSKLGIGKSKIKLLFFREIEIENHSITYVIKTKYVGGLYQDSLKEKWVLQLRKRPSVLKWTNRPIPGFFDYAEESKKALEYRREVRNKNKIKKDWLNIF